MAKPTLCGSRKSASGHKLTAGGERGKVGNGRPTAETAIGNTFLRVPPIVLKSPASSLSEHLRLPSLPPQVMAS